MAAKAKTLIMENKRILKAQIDTEENGCKLKRQHLALYHHDLVRDENTIMGLAHALSEGVDRIGSATVTGQLLHEESVSAGTEHPEGMRIGQEHSFRQALCFHRTLGEQDSPEQGSHVSPEDQGYQEQL